MKNYKDFKKSYIGESDIASLILVGPSIDGGKLNLQELHFGGDGAYHAYIVRGNATIGEHYTQVAAFSYWLKVYDDTGLTYEFTAPTIKVYRAGDFGCIVQIEGETELEKTNDEL